MKANKTLYVVIAFLLCLITSCNGGCECDCKSPDGNPCSCDKRKCNCKSGSEEQNSSNVLTSDEFGNSKWRGKDSNGNNVELEVNMPHMTLTYFHYANGVSKSNKEIVKLVFSTTNYSYNPETGKFKDDNSTNISGVVKDKTTIEISLPKEVVTLTKQK